MKILSLDFDGVLHSYTSGWMGPRSIPDPPTDGAVDFLLAAIRQFDVQIFSSRSRYIGGRRAIRRWLEIALVEWYWRSDMAKTIPSFTAQDTQDDAERWSRSVINQIGFPLRKPPAHVAIDDRAITFTGAWPSLVEIAEFKPWNKR